MRELVPCAHRRFAQRRLRPCPGDRRVARTHRGGASGWARRAALRRRTRHDSHSALVRAGDCRDGPGVHDRAARRDADRHHRLCGARPGARHQGGRHCGRARSGPVARHRRVRAGAARTRRRAARARRRCAECVRRRAGSAGWPRRRRRDHHAAPGRNGAAAEHQRRGGAARPAAARDAILPRPIACTSCSRGIAPSSPARRIVPSST